MILTGKSIYRQPEYKYFARFTYDKLDHIGQGELTCTGYGPTEEEAKKNLAKFIKALVAEYEKQQ